MEPNRHGRVSGQGRSPKKYSSAIDWTVAAAGKRKVDASRARALHWYPARRLLPPTPVPLQPLFQHGVQSAASAPSSKLPPQARSREAEAAEEAVYTALGHVLARPPLLHLHPHPTGPRSRHPPHRVSARRAQHRHLFARGCQQQGQAELETHKNEGH